MTTLADIPGPWRLAASCNPLTADTYFPEQGKNELAAKEVCHGCYVEAECLAYAIDNHERYGTWGGLTTHERRDLVHAKASEGATT